MLICCIVKPPSYSSFNKIVEALEALNVSVVSIKDFYYNESVVDVLYDHMDLKARQEISRRYGGKVGAALLIDVKSIEACREIMGTESDPKLCELHSIRARFGSQ